ncbi:[pt] photosystem II reaction center 13kDa protein [Galdieria sulphuraria]|uniref:Photosystem II reaction center Psb28 protein n=1 Tax=Galdieria sulphuraria TaxID=130081 RepID=M2XER3_GALSU|nr:[pt] photosystem II reaction center 13kDa protein [Galdieria sulphuraria]EME28472.1 [pt] photosystem II reaction center 13kDa protein [Galdieria sulphuraria]|eukprot:XP_005704992.1 [pt] photosystem II reaction center 13kDa protein [Galdieria sulphuraria]
MASIQFITGLDEKEIPDIKLTRSKDGKTDQADITGMYLIDEEGEMVTREVNAKFVNGKPYKIEALYIIKNNDEWDRFMRFMDRYAKEKGLVFTKSSDT